MFKHVKNSEKHYSLLRLFIFSRFKHFAAINELNSHEASIFTGVRSHGRERQAYREVLARPVEILP